MSRVRLAEARCERLPRALLVVAAVVAAGCYGSPNGTAGTGTVVAAVVAAGCYGLGSSGMDNYTGRGQFRVGLTKLYFHDIARPFDSWNAKHASDEYKAVLAEINAAGERQIVAAYMWYPSRADASGRAASFYDFSVSRSGFFTRAFEKRFLSYFLPGVSGPGIKPGEDIFSKPRLLSAISGQIKDRAVSASYGADIAGGRFPIVIAAHGLGGGAVHWAPFAEYLASHGYIVVAPSFVSDSGAPNVLDSPDSAYFARAGFAGLERAYRTILGEFKVIPGFYKYFFGYEGPVGFQGPPEGLAFRAVPNGGRRVGRMMVEFFDQRVGDLQAIMDGLESLDKDRAACLDDYASRGQHKHGAGVCGAFTAALDITRIGMVGHSLGSMTAQFASARDDRVSAAVGYNNGPPRYWEPTGIFGEGVAEDGQPAGAHKPLLLMHGSEDAFVQGVFRGLMWNMLSAAGGAPEDIWHLERERVLPTNENPQPVVRNAYHRATGDKMIVSVKDVNHGSLVDDFRTLSSKQNPFIADGGKYWSVTQSGRRKAVGRDALNPAFQGGEFMPLNWGVVRGETVYLPVFIRNYYTKNWLDFHLKGEARAAAALADNPVKGKNILDIRASISSGRVGAP